tara:strand:+ start:1034 stop:1360 length:327 start_codon:yes stop_codon:yes gene_type:complete
MEIEIKNLPKKSFNVYNNLHWANKKKFKDAIKLLVYNTTKKQFKGGYSLNFKFTFKGKLLDTVNVFHYCKIIEDSLFKQDNMNRKICVTVEKGRENKCLLTLKKIYDN